MIAKIPTKIMRIDSSPDATERNFVNFPRSPAKKYIFSKNVTAWSNRYAKKNAIATGVSPAITPAINNFTFSLRAKNNKSAQSIERNK